MLMPRSSLPASSLRDRGGLPHHIPEGMWSRLPEHLIWRILFAIGPVITGTRQIFLPALREGARGAAALAISRDTAGLPRTSAELATIDYPLVLVAGSAEN